jgi:hypothetical protein
MKSSRKGCNPFRESYTLDRIIFPFLLSEDGKLIDPFPKNIVQFFHNSPVTGTHKAVSGHIGWQLLIDISRDLL